MSDTIKFGTDGWRGVIAEDYTFDNVRRAAQGFASYMQEVGHSGSSIVVGYDKRFGSEHFSAAVAEVLAGNDFRVQLTDGPTPTPVIAYSVLERKSAGAVNITASHNPPRSAQQRLAELGYLLPKDVDGQGGLRLKRRHSRSRSGKASSGMASSGRRP